MRVGLPGVHWQRMFPWKFRKEERADGFPSAPMSFHPSKEV